MATTYDDGHLGNSSRSRNVLAVTIVMISLSTAFVVGRFLSRGAIVKRIMIDDYFILLAWTIALGLSFTVCYGTAYGLGKHEWDIPSAWQQPFRELVYAVSVMYQPALMATKTSILAFYLSLSTADRIFKWACIVTLFVVNAGGLALTFVTAFQCRPINALFQPVFPTDAQCTDILTIYLASVPLNLITDLALLLLPMPILTAMRLPRKQKIILVVTFSAGVFVAVVDVVRISYLQSAAKARLNAIQTATASGGPNTYSTLVEEDTSWYLAYTYLWTAIEVNVGIMCACVPALKPLVARFLPTMLKDAGESSRLDSLSSEKGPAARTGAAPDVPAPPLPADVRFRDFGTSVDSSDSGQMGMLDFLTTPDMNELPLQRSTTAHTNTSRDTAPPGPPTLFDFVNMKQHRSLVQMSHRESVFPIAMVTILFFIWGFEYGLLNVLNKQFQQVANVTPGQSAGIHSAYFAGYFAGPPTVGWLVMKNWGFRKCFPIGMLIYAGGLLIYWPAAVLASWQTFIVTNFIVGFGLSILEVACNPFVVLCGPSGYGEIRLLLSQGLQAVGSVVAPLIAQKAFLTKDDAYALVNTQWAYLGIALATVILAIIYFYVPLPDATDAELADAEERPDGANTAHIDSVPVIWISLGLAVFAQFCYVGGQEVNGTDFGAFMYTDTPSLDTSNFSAIAHTAFAVSRFLAAGLAFWIKPRYLIAMFFAGLIIFEALAISLPVSSTGLAMLIMSFFMEGPLFPLIFAQGLRGMGRHTRLASVLITTSISGGAVFSPISSHITNATSAGGAYALIAGVAPFGAGFIYAVALIFVPKLRRLVEYPPADPLDSPRPSSLSSRAGKRALHFIHHHHLGKKSRESPHRQETMTTECRENAADRHQASTSSATRSEALVSLA